MALDFSAPKDVLIPDIDTLIQRGVEMNAFGEHGWIHDQLVHLARNHGVHAYREEYRSFADLLAQRLIQGGLQKIIKTIEEGKPVIVSVEKGFEPSDKFHQVIIVGYENGAFLYHDPETPNDSGTYLSIPIENFLPHWRHLAIFVG